MKKLALALILSAAVSAAFADKVRLGTVVVADHDALARASVKLGELSCNMMLPAMLAQPLAETPTNVTEYTVFVDEAGETSAEKVPGSSAKLRRNELLAFRMEGEGVRAMMSAKSELQLGFTELQRQTMKDFRSLSMTVKLDDRGLSVEGDYAVSEDSPLLEKSKTGAPLAADALAFAGKDCLFAAVATENGGIEFSMIPRMLEALKKNGVDLSGFIAVTGNLPDVFVTIDADAAARILPTMEEACSSINHDKLEADYQALGSSVELPVPACRGSVALKGYAAPYTPAERFDATLPDFAEKPLAMKAVWSYYSLCKAFLPCVIANAPEDKSVLVRRIAMMLPGEMKGACAAVVWDVNPTTAGFIVRISTDEIKSFGLASGAVMTMIMASAYVPEPLEGDDDAADDED